MASKVYFTDMRAEPGNNLLQKLKKLIIKAGIDNIDFNNKYVAIKVHFGEPGNMAYLRPNYARVIVDYVKSKGGKPFLTDCNTLYVGNRKDALEHLTAAYENGFNPLVTNCHTIIADGLRGTDEQLVEVVGGTYVKQAKIGKAIMDADIFISLNHFKGHETAGFGGAIKNIGMGCGSRAGKMEQHCDGKPTINLTKCRGCHKCSTQCAQDAIYFNCDGKAVINIDKCVGCGRCLGECNFNAIHNSNNSSVKLFNMKMAEYASAVLRNRPNFHINLIMDVAPVCDCRSANDTPIVADIGMLASFDPVALDKACVDKCNQAPVLPNSQLAEQLAKHTDLHEHFKNTNVNSDWQACLTHCQELGVGEQEYELVSIDKP
ncbi:MAG: DUF362 domain-containing protein [Clostridia bacterium]